MLHLIIPERELFNNKTQMFINVKEQRITLEHSLVSVSKWESKWHKPFLGNDKQSITESIDYIRCMTITPNVDPLIYQFCIDSEIIGQVSKYIDDPMTATTITEYSRHNSKEILTSEVIYSMMIDLGIPFECEKWHLNRLIMLIRVCSKRNSSSKKMGKRELMTRNSALNAERRARLNSRG